MLNALFQNRVWFLGCAGDFDEFVDPFQVRKFHELQSSWWHFYWAAWSHFLSPGTDQGKNTAQLPAMTKNSSGKPQLALLIYFWKKKISKKPSPTCTFQQKKSQCREKKKINDWGRENSSGEWDFLGVWATCLIFTGHIPQNPCSKLQVPLHIFSSLFDSEVLRHCGTPSLRFKAVN